MKTFNDFINEGLASEKNIRIVIVGTIDLNKDLLSKERAKKYKGLFDDVSFIFKESDIVIGNLLNNFGGDLSNGDDSSYIDDDFAEALKELGFTHISICNRNLYTNGVASSQRTIEILEKAGIIVLSPGKTDININGYSIDILTYTSKVDKNIKGLSDIPNRDIETAKTNNVISIAYPFWTKTRSHKDISKYIDRSISLKNKGYNVVAGCGIPNLNKIELIEDNIIMPSLGNFLSSRVDNTKGTIIVAEFLEEKINKVIEYNIDTTQEESDYFVKYLERNIIKII